MYMQLSGLELKDRVRLQEQRTGPAPNMWDEVIAVSEKVIVKLEDLVKWAHSDFSKWRCGLRATPVKTEACGRNGQKEALLRYRQSTLNSGLNFKDVLKEKADLGRVGAEVDFQRLCKVALCTVGLSEQDSRTAILVTPDWGGTDQTTCPGHQRRVAAQQLNGIGVIVNSGEDEEEANVIVLSYPQYCRYRSMLKRIQDKPSSILTDQFALALGGIAMVSRNPQILYCRDTFDHPTLIENESICDEFAVCASMQMPLCIRARVSVSRNHYWSPRGFKPPSSLSPFLDKS
ncbi:hypothetical protein STEG23_014124, partial [Scotinomys teguina]